MYKTKFWKIDHVFQPSLNCASSKNRGRPNKNQICILSISCDCILRSFGWDSYNSDTLCNWLQANNNWLHLRFQCMWTWVLPVALQLLFEATEAIVHNLGKTILYTSFRRKVNKNVSLPLGAWASLRHSQQKKCPFPQSTAWDVRGGALGENIFITFGWPFRM